MIGPIDYYIERIERLESEDKLPQARNESKYLVLILDALNLILGCAAAIFNCYISPNLYLSGAVLAGITFGFQNPDKPCQIIEPPLSSTFIVPPISPLTLIRSGYTYFPKIELGFLINNLMVIAFATLTYPFTNNQEYDFYNQFIFNLKNLGRSVVYLSLYSNISLSISKIEAKIDKLHKLPQMNVFLKKLQDESPSNFKTFGSLFKDLFTFDTIIDPVMASNGRVYEKENIYLIITKC